MLIRKHHRANWGAIAPLFISCALLLGYAQGSNSGTTKAPVKSSHKRRTVASSKPGTMHPASSKRNLRRKKTKKVRGQQKIDSTRAQAIQAALIREHYLSGEPTGEWNQASEEAMRRYQADQGWQSKTVPDSRALIKLGLGPSKDHLLNPESAMTTVPDPPKSDPIPTTSSTNAPNSSPAAPASHPANADSSSPQ